jgi:hypothetical protein
MLDSLMSLFKKKKKVKGYKRNYPKTVEEVLDDSIVYKKETNDAVIKFKKMKPWKGTKEEIQTKFKVLCHDLALAYEIEEPQLVFVKQFGCGSCYFPVGNLIILTEEFNKLYSAVTFLHEFGHALYKDEKATCTWSINLFKRHFPKSFSRLQGKGHLLCRPESPMLKE